MTQAPAIASSDSSSSADLVVVQVPPEGIYRAAPRLWPLLERAVSVAAVGGLVDVDGVLERCHRNALQLWVVLGDVDDEVFAVVVTQVVDYPNGRVCEVLLCAGHQMQRWAHLLETIEQWAREADCTRMELSGRPGWGRIYTDYSEAYRVFAKEL